MGSEYEVRTMMFAWRERSEVHGDGVSDSDVLALKGSQQCVRGKVTGKSSESV